MRIPRGCSIVHLILGIDAAFLPVGRPQDTSAVQRGDNSNLPNPQLVIRSISETQTAKHHCEKIHEAADRCEYAKKYCSPNSAGMVDYIGWYYCDMSNAQPVAFTILVAWTATLFSTIGIASSDFFCPNLATIASSLGMSQSVAGVTFLAFGNGSPDVFSTFAAFKAHSGSLAIGELLGAAAFITSVVAGSMAIISPFKVSRRSFLRDAGFFMVAVVMTMVLLADGRLRLWESILMIVFYAVYVAYVLIGTYYNSRKTKRKIIDSRIRSHYTAPGGNSGAVIDDDMDEDTARLLSENQQDIANIENGESDNDDASAELDVQDIKTSMSVIGRSDYISSNAVRPSLLGALEFRELVSNLAEDGAVTPNTVISMKRRGRANSAVHYAASNARARSNRTRSATVLPQSADMLSPQTSLNAHRGPDSYSHAKDKEAIGTGQRAGREAARPILFQKSSSRSSSRSPGELRSEEIASSSLRKHQPIELLSPNNTDSHQIDHSISAPDNLPSIRVETPHDERDPFMQSPHDIQSPKSTKSSPRAPSYETMNDTVPVETASESHEDAVPESSSNDREHYVPEWWPTRFLPSPGQLKDLLFPTLVDFAQQSYTSRVLAILALPSVFVLTITLPVVNPPVNQKMAEVNEEGADLEAVIAKEDGERYTAHRGWNRWLTSLQCILTPLLVSIIIFFEEPLLYPVLISLAIGLFLLTLTLLLTTPHDRPAMHSWFCFIGFAVSVCWISTIANEVVGTLQAFGTILGLSDAILGLTVFAVGNSLGDFVADVTVARMGFSQMAISGVFGGPMLNILLGIGISGIYINLSKVREYHTQFHFYTNGQASCL